jgi:hypothetical protein
MESNFINLAKRLYSNPEFRKPATLSIKVNNYCKGLLSSQSGMLIPHNIKFPFGQLIHLDIAYALETNSTRVNSQASELEMLKIKNQGLEKDKYKSFEEKMTLIGENRDLRKKIKELELNS